MEMKAARCWESEWKYRFYSSRRSRRYFVNDQVDVLPHPPRLAVLLLSAYIQDRGDYSHGSSSGMVPRRDEYNANNLFSPFLVVTTPTT
jgi:hypothetical protein